GRKNKARVTLKANTRALVTIWIYSRELTNQLNAQLLFSIFIDHKSSFKMSGTRICYKDYCVIADPNSSIESSHEYSNDSSTDNFSDAASGDDASMYSSDECSDGESVEGVEIGSDERQSTENECLNEEYLIHPNLSVKEGSLLVFAFILRHRITNEGIQHLLDLIRLFCPGSKFLGS
ncbi:unnamed protein product, partial [Allacma fusca]